MFVRVYKFQSHIHVYQWSVKPYMSCSHKCLAIIELVPCNATNKVIDKFGFRNT